MKSSVISHELVRRHFSYRQFIVVENVSFGLLDWECDLLVMPASRHLYEIEIKTSIADLKKDVDKGKWHPSRKHHERIRRYYMAMPEAVYAHKHALQVIPEFAGIFVTDADGKKPMLVRPPTSRGSARKLTEVEAFKLARLGTMRYWYKRIGLDDAAGPALASTSTQRATENVKALGSGG